MGTGSSIFSRKAEVHQSTPSLPINGGDFSTIGNDNKVADTKEIQDIGGSRSPYSPDSGSLRAGDFPSNDNKVADTKEIEDLVDPRIQYSPIWQSWDINPFEHEKSKLIEYAWDIMESYGLLTKFGVERSKFTRFLNAVALRMNPNKFHNFVHCWSVFQTTYLLIRNGAEQYLTPFYMLGALIAAICHDLHHPGNDNNFEKKSRSAIYERYQNNDIAAGVLERYHFAETEKLLENPDTDILSALSPEQRSAMLTIIKEAILATDMSRHFRLMDELALHVGRTPHFEDTDEDRTFLVRILVHCADLSGQALRRDLAQKWGGFVLEEFIEQFDKESAANIEVSESFRNLKSSELARFECQRSFVDIFVSKQWELAAQCFPALQCQADQANKNLAFYTLEIAKIKEGAGVGHLAQVVDAPSERKEGSVPQLVGNGEESI